MRNLWGAESNFARFFEKVLDIIVLNFLTVLCSLPIITLGASVSALYHTVRRMQRDEGSLYRGFFRAFKDNFKQATLLWLVVLGTGVMWGFTMFFYSASQIAFFRALNVLVLVLWVMAASWVFPLQAIYYNPVKTTLKNAVICMVAYLPRSLLMAVINLVPVVFVLYLGLLGGLELVGLLVWFALAADINLRILEKPLEQIETNAKWN